MAMGQMDICVDMQARPRKNGWAKRTDEKKEVSTAVRRPLELCFGCRLPFWKRAFDLVGSGIGLLLLSPLFLLIAIYIKIVSPGPVFFRQKRIGWSGREFTMWKFRSMHPNADASVHRCHIAKLIQSCMESKEERSVEAMTKIESDPRIIPFGVLFRKSCLDELPQLVNVFIGDMSLIGPRPAIRYEVDKYLQWHKGRFDTIPGMTGLWQVSGKNKLSFKEMVRLDIRYARERSPWLDIKILLKTLPAIMTQVQENWLARQRNRRVEAAGEALASPER